MQENTFEREFGYLGSLVLQKLRPKTQLAIRLRYGLEGAGQWKRETPSYREIGDYLGIGSTSAQAKVTWGVNQLRYEVIALKKKGQRSHLVLHLYLLCLEPFARNNWKEEWNTFVEQFQTTSTLSLGLRDSVAIALWYSQIRTVGSLHEQPLATLVGIIGEQGLAEVSRRVKAEFYRLFNSGSVQNKDKQTGLTMTKPNYQEMTRKELRAYILAHHDDKEAIYELFVNRRNPNAVRLPADISPAEIERFLREQIRQAEAE